MGSAAKHIVLPTGGAMRTFISLLLVCTSFTTANSLARLATTEPTETSSGDIPRSDPAWDVTNIIAGEEEDLVAMVTELKLQMKEQRITYARQRSALHLLQEKVNKQEVQFGVLKQTLLTQKAQQSENVADLKILKKEVEDQRWGITDLKESQQRFRDDVLQLKKEQKITNSTLETYMDLIEETYERQLARVDGFELRVDKIDASIVRVSDTLQQGKLNFTGLELAVNSMKKDTTGLNGNNNHNNNVGLIDTDAKEGSGEREDFDRLASTVEENSNTIGHAMSHISKTEEMVSSHVDDIHQQISSQSTQMSELNNSIRNLTDKLSEMERSHVTDKKSWGDAFGNVEDNIVSLSDQVYSILEWQKRTMDNIKEIDKSTVENKQNIAKTQESTIPFGGRIRYMQKLVGDMKVKLDDKQDQMDREVESLRQNATKTSERLQTHVRRATSAIKSAVFKMDDLVPKVSKLDNRLAHVEVKVLNASLLECKDAHRGVIQELRVKNLELEIRFAKENTNRHERHIRSLAGDLTSITSAVRSNEKHISSLSKTVENVTTVVPTLRRSVAEVGKFVQHLPIDCTQLSNRGNTASGFYLIRPLSSATSLPVRCEMTNQQSAWTVIQSRLNGDVSFNRLWKEYQDGFGETNGDFWIGNENLYRITNQANYSVRIEMVDMQDKLWVAEYDNFRVGDEESKYKLTISGFMGNSTDSLSYSNGMEFSTPDVDNDASSTDCALFYTSGWWYKHCHYGNLNGRVDIGIVWFNHDRDEWMQMKKTVMKISRWED